METNQNIQERIDEIFNQNSKIPFMQSKEILQLGYIYGTNDSKQANKESSNTNSNKANQKDVDVEDTGKTPKEMIAYARDVIKEKSTIDEYTLQKQILEAQIQLSGKIVNYMNVNHDIIKMYDYVKDLNREYQHELYKLQTNHGEYKCRRGK